MCAQMLRNMALNHMRTYSEGKEVIQESDNNLSWYLLLKLQYKINWKGGGEQKALIDPHARSHTQASKKAVSAGQEAFRYGLKIHTINLCPRYVSSSMSKINSKSRPRETNARSETHLNNLDPYLIQQPK